MKTLILGLTLAAATLAAGAASAQSYRYDGNDGYRGGYERDYRYDRSYRDSDRDGIPDRAEWNRLGEFRGLGQVIRRIVRGVPIDLALQQARERSDNSGRRSLGETLYEALLEDESLRNTNGTLVKAISAVEGHGRRHLATLLSDKTKRQLLADYLGISAADFSSGLTDLKRRS